MADKQLGGCTGKGFAPGQSGNPGGRPKGRSVASRLRALLDDTAIVDNATGERREIPGGKDVGDLVAEALVRAALKGDTKAHKLIVELTEPKGGKTEGPDTRAVLLAAAEDEVRKRRPS